MGNILAGYQYEIKFRKSEDHCNADGLSGLPHGFEAPQQNSTQEASLFNLSQIEKLPITAKDLAMEIVKGDTLSKVLEFVKINWSSTVDKSSPLYPIF